MILIIYFFSVNFGVYSLVYLLIICSKSRKSSNAVAYTLLLLSFIIQGLFNIEDLTYLLYSTNLGKIVNFVRILFSFYPLFHYAKIWMDISKHSGKFFSFYQ
jgi:hypothetical protein